MSIENFQACKFAVGSIIGKYFFSKLPCFGLPCFEVQEFEIEGVCVYIKSNFHDLITVTVKHNHGY